MGGLPRYTLYQATVVPQTWRLRHRQSSRIFQELATPDILKKVLDTAGISSQHYELRLSNTYEPRNYCVQYRESDWAFACRLMEEDGILHFFEHHEDKHVLVMGDSPGACQPITGNEQLSFRQSAGMVTQAEHVLRFRFAEEIQPGQVSLRDFNFKKPNLPMDGNHQAEQDKELEVYDYPGEYQDPGRGPSAKGASLAKIRLEELQASRKVGQGESDCERLQPGSFFTLEQHPRADFNLRYLLTSVGHHGHQPQVLEEEAQGGAFSYSNSFTCMSAQDPFRPPRTTTRPVVRGVQTATVVGPAGEEIHVDEHGRVKVQFHWDREGKNDDKSSCWVRVSQPWGGEMWGAMFIPRIGQEVVVDFIEGDPDRPLITGRVYNGLNPTPYPLPEEKTKSTFRTNTSPGGEGFNELRFEDKKSQEQVFIHAQRNRDVHVKNDSMENILHDRHQTIGSNGKDGKVGDQNELVYRDKSLKVHRHSQEHIGGDLKLLVGGIDGEGNQDVIIEAVRKEKVGADSHLTVGGNRNEKVGETWSITVGQDLQVKAGANHALEAGQEIHLKSMNIVIEAGAGLTIKGPGGFITIDAVGISVSGTIINLNSGGAALSGSGAAPAEPAQPAQAQPVEPTPADKGRP
ncbi:MAG TPA: type VI secretion system tip protein TssI/VgrG [Archangium sp.]|nr:type VI secretion system tip protein TssI/VgrG [Archangium sp.]